jgi:hypothetical protein
VPLRFDGLPSVGRRWTGQWTGYVAFPSEDAFDHLLHLQGEWQSVSGSWVLCRWRRVNAGVQQLSRKHKHTTHTQTHTQTDLQTHKHKQTDRDTHIHTRHARKAATRMHPDAPEGLMVARLDPESACSAPCDGRWWTRTDECTCARTHTQKFSYPWASAHPS